MRKIFNLAVLPLKEYDRMNARIRRLERECGRLRVGCEQMRKEVSCLTAENDRLRAIEARYIRLTDRDEKGRFVREEGG